MRRADRLLPGQRRVAILWNSSDYLHRLATVREHLAPHLLQYGVGVMTRSYLAAALRCGLFAAGLASVCGFPALAQTAPAPGSQERTWSSGANRVGAFTSRAWAVRGAGVTIAIVDSGIRADHNEFTGALAGGFNALTGRVGLSAVPDSSGHGTHVASLAAARANGMGMAGVASNARILPIKVFEGSSTSDASVANGIRYATSQRAFVVNMSLGGSQSAAIRNALQGAVTGGQVIVVAAGNEGAANPSWPARHASEAWAKGQIIAVGAVDSQNQIATFSNRAGDARNFYLVAPGAGLIGAYHSSPSTYAMMSGTSMASPLVAGAAAVVKSAWPYLSARDVASVLLLSATDLGAKGVDAIYGRGLLNLERAMLPLGPVTTVGAAGSRPLALGASSSPVTIGAMSAAQGSGALLGAVFDGFGRDFSFDFGRAQLATRSDTLALLSSSMDRQIDEMRQTDRSGGMAVLGFAPDAHDERLDRMSLAYLQADGSGWAATKGAASPLMEGLAAPLTGLAPAPAHFASPAAIMDPTAASVALATAPGEGHLFTMGLSYQAAETFGETPLSARRESEDATLIQVGAQRRFDRFALNLDLSLLEESGSRLGEPSGSVFAVAGDARTVSARFGAAFALSDRVTLGITATTAETGAQAGRDSGLVTGVGETSSRAFALSLSAADTIAPGDRMSLVVGQPLMSRAGMMDLTLGVGADLVTGAPVIETRRMSLATEHPELRVELGYAREAGPLRLAVSALSRFDADGENGRNVTAVMFRASQRF